MSHKLTVERIDAFTTALHEELNQQMRVLALLPEEQRDLDRPRLEALFAEHGLAGISGRLIDWEAPVGTLLAQIQHVDEDQLGSMRMILVTHPNGLHGRDESLSAAEVEGSDGLVPVVIPETFGPDD